MLTWLSVERYINFPVPSLHCFTGNTSLSRTHSTLADLQHLNCFFFPSQHLLLFFPYLPPVNSKQTSQYSCLACRCPQIYLIQLTGAETTLWAPSVYFLSYHSHQFPKALGLVQYNGATRNRSQLAQETQVLKSVCLLDVLTVESFSIIRHIICQERLNHFGCEGHAWQLSRTVSSAEDNKSIRTKPI